MASSQYTSFVELRVTARAEFDRILRAGPPSLSSLYNQHFKSIQQVLDEYDLPVSEASSLTLDLGFAVNTDNVIRMLTAWKGYGDIVHERFDVLPERAKFALMLAHTLLYLREQKCGVAALPHLAQLAMHMEVVRAFWVVFVIPELHADGVTRHQRKARHSQAPQRVLELHKAGHSRSSARDRLLDEFGFSRQNANRLLKEVYGPERIRKKSG